MTVTIQFCGAARTVTGSCYHLTHPGGSFLVDCGLFQGSKTLRELNYGAFPFAADKVDFVLLTHAHIDHSGLVPKLIKVGMPGPVFATAGTRDLLAFMLPDSGHIQESEVERLNLRNAQRDRPPVTPIYTRVEAEESLARLRAVEYGAWISCGPGVRARWWNAGHILGAASIEIEIATGDEKKPTLRLLFSGDIGPEHKLFHPDPEAPTGLDYLIVESTYGDRDRPDITPAARRRQLKDEVQTALKRGGNLLIPAFAVERTQELLLDLQHLVLAGEIPAAPVYVDSPLAIRATQVFLNHAPSLEDTDKVPHPFAAPNLRYVETVEQSKALGRVVSGAIIVAASGMCDAGRIRHHLKQNLWRPEATVLFVGYQAPGTLGRLLLENTSQVRIHGEEISVRAAIRRLDVYSGHADRSELLAWVRKRLPVSQATFLTHGEESAMAALRDDLAGAGCDLARTFLPELDDCVVLGENRPRWLKGPRRLPSEAVGGPDWHNSYAALVLDLQHTLRDLGDDSSRQSMIEKLRQVLGHKLKSRPPT